MNLKESEHNILSLGYLLGQREAEVMPPGIYPRKTLEERFWSKVKKTDGCWIWQGHVNKKTHYGMIQVNHAPKLVHVISFEWSNGSIPEGMEIDHLCRNRICVNPDHLEAVKHRDNVLRGINACATNAKVTHCPQGHPYDLFNTYYRPDGGRDCKLCRVRRRREFKARKEVVI